MRFDFSNEIKTGKITNQKKSGRCWLFAALNLFRHKMEKDLNIKDFQLSQTYMMFRDKLEKANYFLECIIDTRKEDTYSRVLMWLLNNLLDDAGQWDMLANLVDKYGVIPQDLMPETHHSSDTRSMNAILLNKLRDNASILRKMHKNGKSISQLREMKDGMLSDFYRMLVYFLGEPPEKFDFEFRDEDNKFHANRDLTPQEFYQKYIGWNMNDYVSIINAPTEDKPFYQTYTVKYLGNVVGGRRVLYLNVDTSMMKSLALSQISDGNPVWFGADVRQWMHYDRGIMDTELYPFEDVFDTSFGLDKAGRLNYCDSLLTHAMVFTGVNIVNGKPNRWKVENTWGDKPGKDGYFVMSDSWFEEFVYQVIVHKDYLNDGLKELLKREAEVLPPWDPMGALARMR
jgi:bleomycin hydrolase